MVSATPFSRTSLASSSQTHRETVTLRENLWITLDPDVGTFAASSPKDIGSCFAVSWIKTRDHLSQMLVPSGPVATASNSHTSCAVGRCPC
jgi:hypothetical protein